MTGELELSAYYGHSADLDLLTKAAGRRFIAALGPKRRSARNSLSETYWQRYQLLPFWWLPSMRRPHTPHRTRPRRT